MFEKFKLGRALDRLVEEKLFELAFDEIEEGNIRRGIWAKAIANSDGNDGKTRSLYVQMRVDAMKDEARVVNAIIKELQQNDHLNQSSNNITKLNQQVESKDEKTTSEKETKKTMSLEAYAKKHNTYKALVTKDIKSGVIDGYKDIHGNYFVFIDEKAEKSFEQSKKEKDSDLKIQPIINKPITAVEEYASQNNTYKAVVIKDIQAGVINGFQDDDGQWFVSKDDNNDSSSEDFHIDNYIRMDMFCKIKGMSEKQILKAIKLNRYKAYTSNNKVIYIHRKHLNQNVLATKKNDSSHSINKNGTILLSDYFIIVVIITVLLFAFAI